MNRQFRRIVFVLGVALLFFPTAGEAVQEQRTLSVRELIDTKSKWPLFAENKIRFSVRGRVQSLTGNEIHMKNCKLRFLLNNADSFPKLKGQSKMIKLDGHFDLLNNKPVFRVTRVLAEFSQEQLHRQRSVDMKSSDPEAWRKLADYTAAEAKFYDDDDLFQIAAQAFEHSFQLERINRNDETPRDLIEWIRRMKSFGVSEDSLEMWEHDRFQQQWRELKTKQNLSSENLLRLARDIAERFPQALKPLEVNLPKLEEAYWKDPEKVFRESDQSRQDRLWRIFYKTLLSQEILNRALQTGENGDRIVKELKDAVPEEREMIREHDEKWMDWRFSRLDVAGRDEAVQLSAAYRERNEPERAIEVLKTWLEERLKTWQKEGAVGYVRAARESVSLLEDRERAYELLEKAWKLSPGEQEIEDAFASIGYRRHSGQWITTDAYAKLPPDPIEEAIRSGDVIEGMTPSQVKRSVGVAQKKQLSFSAGHISEAWIYGEESQTQLVVHFLRASHLPAEKGKVIAIGEQKATVKVSK
ncbi:MAG: hypothetical protein HUJ26_02795 [Planctomycetaceae bacterium]|nr:hypothetical protein [Planctomycetaceae bacterium]